MQSNADDLRTRMASLDTEKLDHIIHAGGDEYTDEAIAAARAELSSRSSEEASATPGAEANPRGWTVAESLRALAALALIWIGWVGVIGFARLVLSLKGFGPAVVFAAVATGCFLLARAVSSSWSRLIVVVPVVFGCFFVIRASLSSQPAEPLFGGIVLIVGGSVAAVLRASRRRSSARTAG